MKNFKILLLISLITSCLMVNAQAKFKAGLAGGVNYANFSGSDVSGNKSLMGFNGGLITEIKFPIKLGVEADVLFSTKGASLDFDPTFSALDYKLSYIDVPVVAKIYMVKVVNFQLGAQYSILASAKVVGDDVKDGFKSGDMAAVIGFGLDVSLLHFSCRYNYGLTSIDEGGSDVKNNMLTFSVGIWLKK